MVEATSSPLRRLVVQALHYAVTGLFALIAGLITFPLLTRVFSIEEYGVMNLVAATLTVSVALAKVGVQHGIVRYYSEISANKSRYSLVQLYSTTLFGMLASALFVIIVLVVGVRVAPASMVPDPRLPTLIAIVSILIIVQVIESAIVNLLRAEQRSAVLMKYHVAKKYLGLALIIGAVLLIARSLTAFYSAMVVGEAIALGILARVFFGEVGRPRPALSRFSRPLYVEMLGFGIPMMIGQEFAGLVLAVGDRYVIEGLLGAAPLGLYVAAYNLCQFVQGVILASIGQAIVPIYMQMYDEKGPEATSEFLSRSLRTYVVVSAPVIAGVAAVGPELLPSLASEKYASASAILPWVIAGMVMEGATTMLGAGLYIHRKTRWIMVAVLSCATLNIALNFVLVPKIGILGSAIATLVSYIAVALSAGIAGRRFLRVDPPWTTILRAGIVATLMYLAVMNLLPGRRLLTVAVRAAAGAPIYMLPMMLIDADGRALVGKVLKRFRRGG